MHWFTELKNNSKIPIARFGKTTWSSCPSRLPSLIYNHGFTLIAHFGVAYE